MPTCRLLCSTIINSDNSVIFNLLPGKNTQTTTVLGGVVKLLYLPRRGKVESPVPGSVVFCNIFGGNAEHSGIYVGNNQIVQLSGNGNIEKVTPEQFVARKGNNLPYYDIYVSCRNRKAVGSNDAVQRAMELVGKRRNYNLILDNCHQFTAGCLTGYFENPINFFILLELEVRNIVNLDNWRIWNR